MSRPIGMAVRPPGGRLRLILFVAVLLLVGWYGIRACMPPPVPTGRRPATAFSVARAMADIHAIALRPHPVGTVDHDRVAALLTDRLRRLGLRAEQRHYLAEDTTIEKIGRWSQGETRPSELSDIIAILPGRGRTRPAVLLMAHYDTVWGSPGAADDSVGVASVIETVRAMEARGTPARDVIVLLTDGEETGLAGARAFFAGGGLASHVGVVINLEARGAGGRAVMFETGPNDGAMMALFARVVPHPAANSLAASAYARMPNRTDFTVAREQGLPGFNFAFTDRAGLYHSPLATPDRVDPRTVQDMGDQALAIASALAFADALPGAAPDATFFDLAGQHLVQYRAGAGWLVILAGVAALGAAAWRQRPGVAGAAAGLVLTVWMVTHSLLALVAFNQLSGAGPNANYYDRLAALPLLEAQAVLVLAAIGIAALSLRAPGFRLLGILPALVLAIVATKLGAAPRPIWPVALLAMVTGAAVPRTGVGGWGGWIGSIGLLLLTAIGVQIALPQAAWLFAWPALLLGMAALAAAWIGAHPATLVIAAVAAVTVSTPLVPVAHVAMSGLGASDPPILLLVAPTMFAAIWPLARMRFERPQAIAIALCLIVAGGIALHIRTDPLAPSVPAYSLGG